MELSARAGRADRFTPFTGDRPDGTRRVIGRTVAPLDVAPDIRHGMSRTVARRSTAGRLRRRRRSGRTERGTGRTFALVVLSARAGRADRFTPFTGDRPDGTRREIGRTVAPVVRRHETDTANGCAARCCAGHPTRHRTHGKRHRTRRTSGRATRRTDGRERHRPQTGRERGRHRPDGCAVAGHRAGREIFAEKYFLCRKRKTHLKYMWYLCGIVCHN